MPVRPGTQTRHLSMNRWNIHTRRGSRGQRMGRTVELACDFMNILYAKAEEVRQVKVTEELFVLHLSRIFATCNMLNLRKHFQKNKQRVVLPRRTTSRMDDGYNAVFAEQDTSASQVAAARCLDTISSLPGVAGEANDAVSAFTQVHIS